MKWYHKMLAAAGIVGLALSTTACGPSSMAEKQEKLVKKMTYKLDLTDAQIPYAETLADALMNTRKAMKAKRQEQMPQLRAELAKPNLDKATLNQMIDAQTTILQANRDKMLDALIAFHAQLNAEQKTELDEMMEKLQKRFDKGRF